MSWMLYFRLGVMTKKTGFLHAASAFRFAVLGVGSLALFLAMTWPLPRYWAEGIPSSAQNIETPAARAAIPGDHLQLLYHFDLVGDMFSGRIPFFHNVYEFNTGDDAERYRPGAYFFPLSGLYTVLKSFMGQAAAWNTTLWVSVWFSAWFAVLWLRRFTHDPWVLIPALTIWLAMPFRWASLMGGSPAGVALMWVPLLYVCLDRALVSPDRKGGFALGLLMLLLFWADLQVFYLSMLTLPVVALVTMGWKWDEVSRVWKDWWKPAIGTTCFLGLIGVFYLWRKSHLSGSMMEGGRSWHELAIFSPRPRDLLRHGAGHADTVYLGWGVAAVFGAALILSVWYLVRSRKRDWVRVMSFWAMAAVILGAVALALGVHGPSEGLAIRVLRKWVPHYDMIRQPFKIFAVVPLWLAWVTALGFSAWFPATRRGAVSKKLLLPVAAVWIAVPWFGAVDATVCLLKPEQEAYAAVADDAAERGVTHPRVLVVPLWPGDSAETSVPMTYARHYDLRMVNGYSPVVSEAYFQQIFRRLESVNQGRLTSEQADFLLERGVEYVLVHENMFPEKVSPFPIAETLRRLDGNDRLTLLERSGPVHAYRVVGADAAEGKALPARGFPVAFPARRWEAERQSLSVAEGNEGDSRPPEGAPSAVEASDAGGGAFVRFDTRNGVLETRAARVAPAEDVFWWVRARGVGTFVVYTLGSEWTSPPARVPVETDGWKWLRVPVDFSDTHEPIRVRLRALDSGLEVDTILLVAGNWPAKWTAEEGITVPAEHFFHAGYADASGGVVFRPEYEPDRVVFYGPRLPVPKGRYRIRLQFETEAEEGTSLGAFRVEEASAPSSEWIPVLAGEVAEILWTSRHGLPVDLQFRYNREAEMTLVSVEFLPLGDGNAE